MPLYCQQPTTPAELEPIKTSITISDKIEAEAPANISVLGRPTLRAIPGVNLDDRLRSLPGFTLFRRSSSLVAHPTTQGVSLRGLGSSGASRTLVLWDGVPVNDPFGGWVYWSRFPPEELERIEVARGAATSLYGDRAMSGAIALFSRPPEPHRVSASYDFGNRASHGVSAGYSHLSRRWATSLGSRAYTTNGYYIVAEERRGRVDEEAAVRFLGGNARLDRLGDGHRLYFKFDLLAEQRKNGTQLTRNSTGLSTLSAHYQREFTRDSLSLSGSYTREDFLSTFSSITANRNVEVLSYKQTVPSEAVGAAGAWNRRGTQWNLYAGGDYLGVEGYSTDALVPTGFRVGGGRMNQGGAFGQFDYKAGPARLFLGARQNATGLGRHFFSPSAGVSAGNQQLRARGTVYRAFRAPTLNELYREFRVGNTVTRANDQLTPETVTGVELGFDFTGESTRGGLTFYRNSLGDLITNVTLPPQPPLIIRQRQNAASALARGIEADLRQTWRNLRLELGYLYADSRFSNGKRIPQTPRHHGSAQLTYARGGTVVSGGLRAFSLQFEDELNSFLLPGFATAQVSVSQRLSDSLSLLGAIENVLDRQYVVGFSPTPLIGAPILWRAGMRWDGRLR